MRGKSFRLSCQALVALLALGSITLAQTTPAKPQPARPVIVVPPAAQFDPAAMQWAVRASIARGLTYLTNQAATDASGWPAPPIRTHRLIGYTNLVIRFSERPTPLYEYENYTVYERRPGSDSQSARTLKPVTRRRIKGVIDPEGGPKILYRDPNGPIVREIREGVYDRTGPDRWPHGTMGLNGMALYTLIRAGLTPDDPTTALLADELIRLIEEYGVPDATHDLAWLIVGLAHWPGEAAAEVTRNCTSKLLDGQILEGEAPRPLGSCLHQRATAGGRLSV